MALTIYGSPRSRTMRVLWAAAELGLAYDHVALEWSDPALKDADFLKLNPAGAIPTIVDDGFALSESLAIILYLAKKFGGPPLYPGTQEGEADVWRWALWAQGALEPWVQGDVALRELQVAAAAHIPARVDAGLQVLERGLADRAWLCGCEFSVADLGVAAILSPTRAARLDLAAYPGVQDWLTRCYARPACVAARKRYGTWSG
jgi:glutathione S-transferase